MTGAERAITSPSSFRRAVEAAGHAIFFADASGEIVYVNPAFEEMTGYPAEEAIGRTPAILNSGHHDPEYFERLWETIASGDVWEEEVVNRRRDGETYLANQTIAPVADREDGTISHFVAIQTDVTTQREYRREIRRQQDLSTRTEAKANVGGWELNPETDTLRWTAGTRRLHQVESAYEPTVDDALEFYHPDDRGRIENAVTEALEWNLPYDVEARLVTAEGSTRVVRTTGTPVAPDDGGTLLRGTITDITDEQTRQQQLMVFNRILRHNLRNELNVVLGHAGLLRDSFGASDASVTLSRTEALDALEDIEAAADGLLSTAERAREFDRVYRQLHDTTPVEIRPLADAVAAQHRAVTPAATVRVEGLEPVLLGNSDALRLVLEELVENAVEHTDEEAPTVTVRLRETADGSLQISIADHGRGLPELERQVLTEGEESQLKHGRGIGLWVVKWLLTPLGGSLEMTENEPKGTVVRVTFPPSRWTSSSDAA
ncbi:PAS domain S-box protein [Salinirubellus salinus]|uniref:histidine kinase n=1 Tax=Salinirubellus salinus TaxID=1364945 RepID=A0A9E7R180_9EURY|nr:PAS domain S-box protein [Salinirubellus salinus]UWM53840.1 PAS domain S-box protein [Salinirubellus salinus]